MQPALTVLVLFHREEHLVRAALRSAQRAAEEARRHGVGCRVAAVIDRGNERTRQEVHRLRPCLDAVHEVDFGDVSRARNHGIAQVDTPYFATLDGDDLLDRDWLWKGIRLLEELGGGRTVAHAAVRMSFGAEQHGRIQIPTEGPLFHPLNLIASWHYAADIIAPTDLFRRHPFTPYDREHNLGAEDWHWSCESLMEDIRHVIVPETTYFYRRQSHHVGLGAMRGFTFPPTRLLEQRTVANLNASRPSAAIRFADRSAGVAGPQERWTCMPAWLEASLERACDLELELYDLHRQRRYVCLETPHFFPAVNHFYLKLMAQLGEARSRIVFFCDRLAPDGLEVVEAFLCAQREAPHPPLEVLIVSLAPVGWEPAQRSDGSFDADSPQLRLRHVDLGAEPAYARLWPHPKSALLLRFLLQVRPALVVNLDSPAFDDLIAEFGPAVASGGTRTVRICQAQDPADHGALADWRSLLQAEARYTLALCRSLPVAERLNAFFHGSGLAAVAASLPAAVGAGGSRGATLHRWLAAPGAEALEAGDPPLEGPALWRASHSGAAPDLSVVVSAGSEGYYLNATLQCLAWAVADAKAHGLEVELLVVAGQPGPSTGRILSTLERRWPGIRVVVTGIPDEGAALNAGLDAARGQYLAVLPAAELVSPGWLALALRRCAEAGPDAIVHPELLVEYGSALHLRPQADQEHTAFEACMLGFHELWTAHALARRELFLRLPYRCTPAGSGLGHAPWHWTCETFAAGCRHLTVPGTAVYRRSAGAVGESVPVLGKTGAITLPPSRFFTSPIWLAGSLPERAPANWDEAAYLRTHPDVAQAVSKRAFASGFVHYRRFGQKEGRLVASVLPDDWDEATYLRACPDVAEAVRQGVFSSGYIHYCRHGRPEGRTPAWMAARPRPRVHALSWRSWLKGHRSGKTTPATVTPALLPRWLDEELQRLAGLDPGLEERCSGAVTALPERDAWAVEAYRACWKTVALVRPTHVILAPGLRPGGAERAMELILQALLEEPGVRPLVITTESEANLWGDRLPAGCAWLPFPAGADGPRLEVLIRLLLNAGARTLHLFYSQLGWEALRQYAPVLADRLRIFVSIFSVPPPSAGVGAGYASFLGPLLPCLAGILTDNERAATRLCDVFGLPAERVTVLRHPVAASPRFQGPRPGAREVLWAGRLDADKRPDLLRAIAERLPSLRFHVYGTPVTDDPTELDRLRMIPNVECHGPFQGFDTIAEAPYLCFLYTSRSDGMPNVLLEAMRAGLLVVASEVGDIAEVVTADTGLLVRDVDDPSAYAAEIVRALHDSEHWLQVASEGQRRVIEGYTDEAFRRAVRSLPGYLA